MDGDVFGGVNGQWMTYAELAQTRGIDKPSALKLALRRKWRRRRDNHGRMQVYVPTDSLPPHEERICLATGPCLMPWIVACICPALWQAFDSAIAAIREANAAEVAALTAANQQHVAGLRQTVVRLKRELEQARAENTRLTEDANRRGLTWLQRWRRRG